MVYCVVERECMFASAPRRGGEEKKEGGSQRVAQAGGASCGELANSLLSGRVVPPGLACVLKERTTSSL